MWALIFHINSASNGEIMWALSSKYAISTLLGPSMQQMTPVLPGVPFICFWQRLICYSQVLLLVLRLRMTSHLLLKDNTLKKWLSAVYLLFCISKCIFYFCILVASTFNWAKFSFYITQLIAFYELKISVTY